MPLVYHTSASKLREGKRYRCLCQLDHSGIFQITGYGVLSRNSTLFPMFVSINKSIAKQLSTITVFLSHVIKLSLIMETLDYFLL